MSESMSQKIREAIMQSCFCFANPKGQGLRPKTDCPCFQSKEHTCQAVKDKDEFHRLYGEMDNQGLSRTEIMKVLVPQFKGSQWFNDNVKV